MNRFRISTRLLMLVGTLCALLVAIGLLGLFGVSRSNAALKSVYEDRTVPTGQLGEIQALLLRNRLVIANSIFATERDEVVRNADEVARNIEEITKLWKSFRDTRFTTEEEALATQFESDRKRFVQEGLMPALAELRKGDIEAAKRVVAERVRPLYQPVHQGIHDLLALQVRESQREYEAAVRRYETTLAFTVGALLCGVAFSAILGLLLVRSITRSLDEAVAMADAVAAGDLTVEVRPRGRDEIARLLTALGAMRQRLTQVVSSVRENAEQVAGASSQIAQGNADLSSRTEEQASSLEETAASMQQLSSTVQNNAENARQANQLAIRSSEVASEAGRVVAEVVTTMEGISDSARRIADITGVIDGIAFQTNILALNASVEAARAGEQGRGFAVVASEVRTLAHRAAEAAREIKALIAGSLERVHQGAKLVNKTRDTMEQVVAASRRVTDLVGEIAAASQEQSTGVQQVGEAVAQMDQVTQQNAALVEEAAAAAESLRHQAEQLVRTVAVFKLPSSGQAERSATHGPRGVDAPGHLQPA